MRSCALRILLAATISIARVIFCVFLMLRILERISLAPDMWIDLPAQFGFKIFNDHFELFSNVIVVVAAFIQFFHKIVMISMRKCL